MKRAVVLLVAITFLAACAQEDYLSVGYIGPLTGTVSTFGISAKRGMDMAIEELNAKGGVLGKQLKASYEDTACMPKEAITALNKFHSADKKDFIVGPLCGANVAAASEFADQNKRLIVATSGLIDVIPENDGYLFRMYYSSGDEAKAIADYAYKELGADKTYLVYFNSEYGIGYRNAFIKHFEELGGEIVGQSDILWDNDFRTILTEIKKTDADAVYSITASGALGGQFYKQCKEMGLDHIQLSNYAVDDVNIKTVAGDALNGIYFTSPYDRNHLNERGRWFVSEYEERFDEPFYVTAALGYETMMLYAEAAEHCKSTDTDCMREYISSREEIEGIGANYYFNELGGAIRPLFIKKIENGKAIQVENN